MRADTLKEAIINVLSQKEPLTFSEIAKEIRSGEVWRRPKDGRFPNAGQISARANHLRDILERIEGSPIRLKRRSNISTKISRLTYNTRGWVEPSGWEGKSRVAGLHEADYGFGYEEWLFDFGKLIKGYKYGFIEGFRTKNNKHGGKMYDLQLFTINNTEREKYWVARIKNCYVLTDDELKEAQQAYLTKSEIKKMEGQLRILGLWERATQTSIKKSGPNVRFLPEDVEIFDPPISVKHSTFIDNRNRYLIYEWNAAAEIEMLDVPFVFKPSKPNKQKKVFRNNVSEFQSKEIKQLHKKIAEALYNKLIKENGSENISCEVPHNGTYIDMVRKSGNGYILYEIKTYTQLRKNIREAFGQLMEYAYWVRGHKIKELVIVSEKELDDNASDYIEFLRTTFKIPISYQQIEI